MRPGDAGWPVGLRDSVRGQASGPWEPTTGAGSGCVRGPRGVGGACVTTNGTARILSVKKPNPRAA